MASRIQKPRLGLVVLLATALSFFTAPSASARGSGTPSARDLLVHSDRARGGALPGLSWNIQLESKADGEQKKEAYLVKVKGNNALAECTNPARSKGQLLLFNERNLWFYRPGLRKPVSVSPRQRLVGDAANGDIAATNYSRDYTGQVVGEEKVNGQDTWKLELKAKAQNVTYDRIRYWISKDKMLGIKAEFLTLQGKPFKEATLEYDNSLDGGGGKYPFISRMVIKDAAFPDNVTTLRYEKPHAASLGESMFNVNNLVR